MKMKRKDLKDVSDDFSDFSLYSPARKIRRLNVELPPIMEEEEEEEEEEEFEVPLTPYQSLHQEQRVISNQSGHLKIEESPNVPDNEERAIVIFNPNGTNHLLQSPSNFSFSINPNLISGLINQVTWPNQSNSWRLANKDEAVAEDCNCSCVAVVPWVPQPDQLPSVVDNCEMMDAEMVGEENMDVEDSHKNSVMGLGEGLHQWQQQHCLIPQPPCNMCFDFSQDRNAMILASI